jgi:hypothetical protein
MAQIIVKLVFLKTKTIKNLSQQRLPHHEKAARTSGFFVGPTRTVPAGIIPLSSKKVLFSFD